MQINLFVKYHKPLNLKIKIIYTWQVTIISPSLFIY
jgi:hypothetical protein